MIADQSYKDAPGPVRDGKGVKLNVVLCALALSFATLGAQAADGRGPQPEDMDMDMTQLAPSSTGFDNRMGQGSGSRIGQGSNSGFGQGSNSGFAGKFANRFGPGFAGNPALRSLIYVNGPASEPDQIAAGTQAHSYIIDARTLRIIKKVPLEEKPHHFNKVPNQNKAYISHFGGTSVVEVMDLMSNEIVAKIPTENGPRHMSFSEDGRYAFTANLDASSVSKIDTKTDKMLWTSKTTANPNYADPVWNYVFAANLRGSSLTVLDATTGAFVKDVPTGRAPFNQSISCDKRLVMSANSGDDTVSFVDVGTLTEVARVSIMGDIARGQYDSSFPQRLNPRISPDCKYLWVGNQRGGTFAVFDIATRKMVAEVKSAEKGGGSDIAFFVNKGPAAGVVLGTNRYSEFVTVINPNPPFNVIKRIPAGKGTHYVTLNEDATLAYVSSRIAGTFSVYNLANLTEVARKTGFPPIDQAIYISFDNGIRASLVSEAGDAK